MNIQFRNMDSDHSQLWERITAYSLDQAKAQFSFSQRLARDHGWSSDYAQQVIEEYKKLVFLAVAAGHPVTPSDAVDQVWHLHLTYTWSYWHDFCPNVLQMPLHHGPTEGGRAERIKFDDWYTRTLESYRQFFGQAPPASIWPDSSQRFGRDLHFVRTNTEQNWVIPKPRLGALPQFKLSRSLSFLLMLPLTGAVTGCEMIANVPNPLNFTGPIFLFFYILLLIIVTFLAVQVRSLLRLPAGDPAHRPVDLDIYETAYLVEGNSRVVETAIASMIQQGLVIVLPGQRKLVLEAEASAFSNPIEQAVASAILQDSEISRVRVSALPATKAIQTRLRQLELLASSEQSLKAQRYSVLPFLALLLLGAAKIFVGISRDKPVGFLVILCGLVILIGLGFWFVPAHRSRYGDRVLKQLRNRIHSKPVRSAEPDLPLAFALWGISVLPRDVFGDFKSALTPTSSDGGGGGGDGGSSGGCGGCGGCGGG